MSERTRLEERLATAWHDGPPLPPVADRLAAGHRSLRRQRVLTTAATTFVTVAVVGTAAAVTGGPGDPRTVQPAPATGQRLTGDAWAGYDDADELLLLPDARIVERIEDPATTGTVVDSVALDLTLDGERRWYLLTVDEEGGTSATWQPYETYGARDLTEWVDVQLGVDDGPAAGADPANVRAWVRLADGRLEPRRDGVDVVRQVASPDLPGFARPGDVTVAALLRVDGERWWVLARQVAGDDVPLDLFRVSVSQGGPTMASFLEFARGRYGSGAGLR